MKIKSIRTEGGLVDFSREDFNISGKPVFKEEYSGGFGSEKRYHYNSNGSIKLILLNETHPDSSIKKYRIDFEYIPNAIKQIKTLLSFRKHTESIRDDFFNQTVEIHEEIIKSPVHKQVIERNFERNINSSKELYCDTPGGNIIREIDNRGNEIIRHFQDNTVVRETVFRVHEKEKYIAFDKVLFKHNDRTITQEWGRFGDKMILFGKSSVYFEGPFQCVRKEEIINPTGLLGHFGIEDAIQFSQEDWGDINSGFFDDYPFEHQSLKKTKLNLRGDIEIIQEVNPENQEIWSEHSYQYEYNRGEIKRKDCYSSYENSKPELTSTQEFEYWE